MGQLSFVDIHWREEEEEVEELQSLKDKVMHNSLFPLYIQTSSLQLGRFDVLINSRQVSHSGAITLKEDERNKGYSGSDEGENGMKTRVE